ncbi:MAG: sulfatase-like hydrolase/transferase, partial [Acidobacteriota bacterium]
MKGAGSRAAIAVVLAVGAALALGAWCLRSGWLAPATPRPNIVVVLVDTLRADHLGTYGYARDTSPAIDALARRGTVFTTAYSVSNWTNPAIKSMFTGRSPQAVMEAATHDEAIRIPLPPAVTTFAELVQERGYRTAALVDHPGIKPWGNFDQGFEDYTMLYEEGAGGRGGWGKSDIEYVAGRFAEQIDAFAGEPFLIWLHVVYPHRPYLAPEPYRGVFGPDSYDDGDDREQRDAMINAYDAEIRRTDDLV